MCHMSVPKNAFEKICKKYTNQFFFGSIGQSLSKSNIHQTYFIHIHELVCVHEMYVKLKEFASLFTPLV